jgi:multicomponent K+:H+ antiporter subunit A/multicomponent Na+:H+ antiporter subunit A
MNVTGFSHFALLLAAICTPVIALPVVVAAARRRGRRAGYVAMAAPLISMGMLAWLTYQAGARPHVTTQASWIPSLNVALSFLFDGLSVFYGFIICGIGTLVCWYAAEYLSDKDGSHDRFYPYLLMFMTAMLATVFANNLLLLFIFWELTGVASFLLIGFFHEDPAARAGARQALLVTAATGLCMLAGVIMLGLSAGTYSLSEILQAGALPEGRGEGWNQTALILILLGAFGKSAQFPFQFWLPGAMAAPTPVSAYLHSATMVKLGVFLTARLLPVFSSLELWFWLVCGVAFVTMLLGAYLALRSHDLKAILAYTTVSQLGFLIGVYGLGSRVGVQLDFVHVLSHVLYKGSLFMVVGIVDHSTELRDARRLGGLGRLMPVTAFSAAVGAAALAGLPFTTGFISKELMLADLRSLGATNAAVAASLFAMMAVSAAISAAVGARFFFKVFGGEKPADLRVHAPGWSIQIPPLLLASAVLGCGVFPGLLDGMVAWLAVSGLHVEAPAPLTLWHGFNAELLATTLILLAGAGLYCWAERTVWRWAEIPAWLRFDLAFERGLEELGRLSKALTHALRADWPPAYLPIVIFFLLSVLSLAIIPWPSRFLAGLGSIAWHFSPLRSAVALVVIAALIGMLFLKRWTTQLITLSVAGFFQTFYFALYRAPDLAMTQILVESASMVMMLFLLSHFPSAHTVVRADSEHGISRFMHIGLSIGVGTAIGGLVLFSAFHQHQEPIGPRLLELSEPLAEGTNAVNTILVDFRGFDTLGEITVLLIATLGALGLMMRYKRGRSGNDPAPPPGFFLGKERGP